MLYIMQYPSVSYYKVGRSVDPKMRQQQYPVGTTLHLTVVTSDMREAEKEMLSSLRSAEAAAEGIEAMRGRGWGAETFDGPLAKIAQRVTAAARMFPAAPHNLMSPEGAREWYERERQSGTLEVGVTLEQFLINNECLTDVLNNGASKKPDYATLWAGGRMMKDESAKITMGLMDMMVQSLQCEVDYSEPVRFASRGGGVVAAEMGAQDERRDICQVSLHARDQAKEGAAVADTREVDREPALTGGWRGRRASAGHCIFDIYPEGQGADSKQAGQGRAGGHIRRQVQSRGRCVHGGCRGIHLKAQQPRQCTQLRYKLEGERHIGAMCVGFVRCRVGAVYLLPFGSDCQSDARVERVLEAVEVSFQEGAVACARTVI